MNSQQLKDKIRNISKEKNTDFNTLLRLYMYDRFLERLSVSKYKDSFILKGGFYLSTLFGVESRNTMDIDIAFRNANFNEKAIINMIKEIISIETGDNAKIEFLGISPIMDEDEYGGFRIELLTRIDNIKEKFHIDVASGDPITPKEISYKYKPILKDGYINLWAYNIETVLAEKLETILSRAEINGRMRDFYDIYLIYTKDWNKININHLKQAINVTFKKREYTGNVSQTLELIMNSSVLKERWKSYQRKYDYANNINFDDILVCLEKIINKLYSLS